MRGRRLSLDILISTLVLQSLALLAQPRPESAIPRARITQTINDQDRVILFGNRHPLARPENESGLPSADHRMERMILTLKPDPAQQQALDELIADQHNPRSPRYHQWLTPEEFGREFGVSQQDLDQVTNWLRSHGFDIEEVPAGRRSLLFSGRASQVESAFRTPIRMYNVNGEVHHANAADPEIPRALAAVVQGVVSLHDFRSNPAHTGLRTLATPQVSNGGGHFYMGPADFATIYHLGPLYQNSIDGTGQSIAIVGRCNIHLSDVQTFRSYFGLPANNPTVIVNGSDPGIVSGNEEGEAVLDVEWSGAVAKNATVKFVVTASTNSSDGVNLSAQYIVNHNVAPVMSVSFGLCEASEGSSGNSFINSLWQQAASQGITVFVSSGDSGAAGCDGASSSSGAHGRGVNALCSTPYSVCVGGTEFNDASSPSTYWAASSDPTTKSSALQYIPEVVWNESSLATGGSGLWSSGGGASTLYSKPSWQNVNGVPADGKRDVPDVSLTAAGHDGYMIYINGQLSVESGTSAASPSFAGLMSLVVQSTGAAQGNANPTFYTLFANQQSGGATVFHDVTTGNNSVPGVTGFNAGPGYDLATGLGSVDAATLVNHWNDGSTAPAALHVTPQAASLQVVQGAGNSLNVTVGASGSFNAETTLSASNLPSGVTASFAPAGFSAPGSGVSALTLSASIQATPGTYNVQISAAGGGITQQATLALTVAVPPDFAMTLSTAAVAARQGTTTTAKATTTVSGGFSSVVTLAASGLPSGMTAKFAPASFAAPGKGTSTLTLTVGPQVSTGDYNIQVSGSGGGNTHSGTLKVTVTLAPSLSVSADQNALSVTQGNSTTTNVTVTPGGPFSSAVTLSATGLPSGMTAKFTPATIVAPGSGSSTLTLTAGTTETAGQFSFKIVASGGGLTSNTTASVTVALAPTFSITPAVKTISVQQGTAGNITLNIAVLGGFNAPVALSASGLPAGVTAGFSPSTLDAPGSGSSSMTLTAASNATAGAKQITITASGGGVTKTAAVSVTVTPPPGFSLTASKTTATVKKGSNTSLTVTVSEVGGFTASVGLSITGLPSGVTATFTPATVSGAGNHASTLKLTATSGASVGSTSLTIAATGNSTTHTVPLTLTVSN